MSPETKTRKLTTFYLGDEVAIGADCTAIVAKVLHRGDWDETDRLAKLFASAPDLLETLRACWDFIENVPEWDPDRQDKFFALREKVRQVFPWK